MVHICFTVTPQLMMSQQVFSTIRQRRNTCCCITVWRMVRGCGYSPHRGLAGRLAALCDSVFNYPLMLLFLVSSQHILYHSSSSTCPLNEHHPPGSSYIVHAPLYLMHSSSDGLSDSSFSLSSSSGRSPHSSRFRPADIFRFEILKRSLIAAEKTWHWKCVKTSNVWVYYLVGGGK